MRGEPVRKLPSEVRDTLAEIQTAVLELIATGSKLSLWSRRTPLLLQWRRGVRGLEYSTLDAMIGEILERLSRPRPAGPDSRTGLSESLDPSHLREALMEIREKLIPFAEKAKRLLVMERLFMQKALLSPLECADAEISQLREELFGSAMRHGGHFKTLIDAVDRLLYGLIKET